jgi:hypothetical protein
VRSFDAWHLGLTTCTLIDLCAGYRIEHLQRCLLGADVQTGPRASPAAAGPAGSTISWQQHRPGSFRKGFRSQDECLEFFQDYQVQLIIKGGTNQTEVDLWGASIADAQLSCSGGVLTILMHPALLPFATNFTGVVLANSSAQAMQQLANATASGRASVGLQKQGAAQADADPECLRKGNTMLVVCGTVGGADAVIFEHMHVSDITYLSRIKDPRKNGTSGGSLDCLPTSVGDQQHRDFRRVQEALDILQRSVVLNVVIRCRVHYENPTISNVAMQALQVSSGEGVTINRGVIQQTLGLWGGGNLVFTKTQFKGNRAPMFGGAVTLMPGHIILFRECVCLTPTPQQRSRTLTEAGMLRLRSTVPSAMVVPFTPLGP